MKKFTCNVHGVERVLIYGAAPDQFELSAEPFAATVAEIRPSIFSVLIDASSLEAHVNVEAPGRYRVTVGEAEFLIEVPDRREWSRAGGATQLGGSLRISAPMPGKVLRLLVSEGQSVEAGQGLAVVEAMKMQNEIKSTKSGQVRSIFISEGQTVAAGQEIILIE